MKLEDIIETENEDDSQEIDIKLCDYEIDQFIKKINIVDSQK